MHIKAKNISTHFEKNKLNRRRIMRWTDLITQLEKQGGDLGWLKQLLSALEWVLWVALIIVAAAGSIYAVYVGVRMARAESSDQREEAKKRLINIIVSVVVTIALILFFNLLLPLILSSTGALDGFLDNGGEGGDDDATQKAVATMINTAKVLLRI